MINILLNPKKAERHFFEVIFVSFFYSTISIFLSFFIFPEYSSLLMVFLTVISCVYVIQGALKIEEKKEYNYKSEKWILKHHKRILILFLALFIGFVFSFAFWTFALPNENVEKIFSVQISVVNGVKNLGVTGNAFSDSTFLVIFLNNIKVLLISVIFAVFYGAGAVYILVWNASIMGFVIGNLAKTSLGLFGIPISFLKYLIHGVPEMLSYFIASLAGGIIFVAFSRNDFFLEGRLKRILIDTFALLILSVILPGMSALIEVYISSHI